MIFGHSIGYRDLSQQLHPPSNPWPVLTFLSCQPGLFHKRPLSDFGFHRHSRKLSCASLDSHLDKTPVVLESTQC